MEESAFQLLMEKWTIRQLWEPLSPRMKIPTSGFGIYFSIIGRKLNLEHQEIILRLKQSSGDPEYASLDFPVITIALAGDIEHTPLMDSSLSTCTNEFRLLRC